MPEEATRFDFTDVDGTAFSMTPREVAASPLVNNSVYLVKLSALKQALAGLDRDNAQKEEYLSAVVSVLVSARRDGKQGHRIAAMRVDDPRSVMGYNDPAELLEVENYVQSKGQEAVTAIRPCAWYRPIRDWRDLLSAVRGEGSAVPSAVELRDDLAATYGDDESVLEERTAALLATLEHAQTVLGSETPVLIVRSPGRVNVLSRHIDHQGGNCNLITMGYETLMAVHAREDDTVRLFNVDDERFPRREFSIGDLVSDLPWDDWLSLVNSEKVSRMVKTYGGDWSQYVMAAVLRLQKKFSDRKLRGMDIIVKGNVPMAAGLSSSSSLVVGAAEATIAVNRLDTFPAQFVDLCGEGEWFVGTRGGSADHAAVKLGQKGKVIKVRFFDFGIEEVVPFPDDHVMVVCDSGIKAQKSASAKNQFNHRIACYRLGFSLIRRSFPQYAPLLQHLRDVNVRNLGIPLSWIYRILLHLPEYATREELREMLAGEETDPFFATHDAPADGLYPIRGVVLFGLAECERARLYAPCLKDGRLSEIGRMMTVSHDGDRIARFTEDGAETPFKAPTSNRYLLSLMESVESGDPDRVMNAQLQWQPGRYYCSIPTIDMMVDISSRAPGVLGAQLAGAGLGGCMMVLAHSDAVDGLLRSLAEQYYEPAGKTPAVLVCRPIAGSGLVMERG
ncbi:galactokinase family protein [Verrucomicrobiota bacterium]